MDAAAWQALFPHGRALVFLARVAEYPRSCQAPEGLVRGGLAAGLGGVSCPRPAMFRATAASAPAVGWPTPQRHVLEQVLDLCGKRPRWSLAYRHPGGHRTSNMLDRVMRGMNRYFDDGQHLHGSHEASRLALPRVGVAVELRALEPGHQTRPQRLAKSRRRLNKHRYHESWLQNLLVSASLAGYRC